MVLLLALLAGCATSTRSPAPVREARVGAARPAAPVGFYRVEAGDTLYKIAFENGLDYQELARWNRLADASRIQVDQLLRLKPPPPSAKPVTRPATAATTRALPAEPTIASQPIQSVSLATPEPLEAEPDSWTWPSRGPVLARFGDGLNKGIDIGGSRGQAVQAAAPGRVVYAGSGLRGYGKLIIIRHGKTLLSAYAHNARILVAEGQTVAPGQPIAEMGDSDAERVKLHFEIRVFGKPVDPLDYLPKLS
ncbi:MAG: peptidoglycan DD-metalloendopeptidase family protein [Pseudomonadota bacterium]